jgi:5-methylcytosine-specific restriction endonuclease McrA
MMISKKQNEMAVRRRQNEKDSRLKGRHTNEEWETLKGHFNYRCLSCGYYEPEIRLTKDHVLPISQGGSDSIDNIQPLCLGCNCMKMSIGIDFRELWVAKGDTRRFSGHPCSDWNEPYAVYYWFGKKGVDNPVWTAIEPHLDFLGNLTSNKRDQFLLSRPLEFAGMAFRPR